VSLPCGTLGARRAPEDSDTDPGWQNPVNCASPS
jgi:hypothetical protein